MRERPKDGTIMYAADIAKLLGYDKSLESYEDLVTQLLRNRPAGIPFGWYFSEIPADENGRRWSFDYDS